MLLEKRIQVLLGLFLDLLLQPDSQTFLRIWLLPIYDMTQTLQQHFFSSNRVACRKTTPNSLHTSRERGVNITTGVVRTSNTFTTLLPQHMPTETRKVQDLVETFAQLGVRLVEMNH